MSKASSRSPEPLSSPSILAVRRLVAISPHLDDAVLGCGDLIASHPGAVVVTVFAGCPASYPALTSWDARCGFADGADVVAARREEDRAALAELGAQPHWLSFPDTQYGETPKREDVARSLRQALAGLAPDAVAIPLGLFHGDHRLASDAALVVSRMVGEQARPSPTWIAYADAIYRALPGLPAQRLRELPSVGLDPRPIDSPGQPASERKRRAVACYRSQIQGLEAAWDGGHADAFEPERYWRLAPAAAAGSTAQQPAATRSAHDDR